LHSDGITYRLDREQAGVGDPEAEGELSGLVLVLGPTV